MMKQKNSKNYLLVGASAFVLSLSMPVQPSLAFGPVCKTGPESFASLCADGSMSVNVAGDGECPRYQCQDVGGTGAVISQSDEIRITAVRPITYVHETKHNAVRARDSLFEAEEQYSYDSVFSYPELPTTCRPIEQGVFTYVNEREDGQDFQVCRRGDQGRMGNTFIEQVDHDTFRITISQYEHASADSETGRDEGGGLFVGVWEYDYEPVVGKEDTATPIGGLMCHTGPGSFASLCADGSMSVNVAGADECPRYECQRDSSENPTNPGLMCHTGPGSFASLCADGSMSVNVAGADECPRYVCSAANACPQTYPGQIFSRETNNLPYTGENDFRLDENGHFIPPSQRGSPFTYGEDLERFAHFNSSFDPTFYLPKTRAEAEAILNDVKNGNSYPLYQVHGSINPRGGYNTSAEPARYLTYKPRIQTLGNFYRPETYSFGFDSVANEGFEQAINILLTGQTPRVRQTYMQQGEFGDESDRGREVYVSQRIALKREDCGTDDVPETSDTPINGLSYIRNAAMNGWQDPEMLVPHDYAGQWVQQAPMECNFQETRTVTIGCPARHTGTHTRNERRTWTATAPGQEPSWSNWQVISTTNTCQPEPSSGSTGGHSNDSTRDGPSNNSDGWSE